MTASVTYGRAARATPKAPRAASYTTTWDTAILSVTTFNDLLNVTGSTTKSDLEDRNVLFMDDGGPTYLDKLLAKALA